MSQPRALLYTIDEASERLGIHRTWLKRAVSRGAIPHTRIGRHVRFSEDDLQALIAQGHQEPVTARRRKTA